MNTVYLETLGCAKNRVDTEIMMGILSVNSFQFTENPKQADVIIVNTCGFLTEAVKESINRVITLGKNKEDGQCKSLIVAGCMSERYRDSLLDELPEVDGLIGTSDYTQILSCVRSTLEEKERRNYLDYKPKYNKENFDVPRVLSTQRCYAYLKISEGCSNMCSFCNIPFLRGAFSSRPIPHIVEEFKRMLDMGIREINLISQDSSSYGADLPKEHNLLNLIRKLLDSTDKDCWIRIFYSYPNRYPKEMFRLMGEDPRLVPYIDMPFQHISDPVLKSMNRKISADKIYSLLDEALTIVPNLAVRTTFIVGFPTETEDNFEALLTFVQKGYFRHVGVFAYSHEDNIRSAKFGDPIPEKIKNLRRKAIMSAQQKISYQKNQEYIGKTLKVLVSGISEESDLLLEGRADFQGVDVDGTVYINEGQATAGDFANVRITESHPYDLVGGIDEGLT